MQTHFWKTRWHSGQIGFHQAQVHTELDENFDRFVKEIPHNATVLVPLCGKSLDLLYLKEQGLHVIGVELVEQAAIDFFTENKIAFEMQEKGPFQAYVSSDLEIWQGDFFALSKELLPGIDLIYDRAALIALPDAMRQNYVKKLNELSRPGVRQLLITFDYDQSLREGPPFAISASYIEQAYSTDWIIEAISNQDVLPAQQRFARQGLTYLNEAVYILEKK